ncbi:MAG TPA: hypothetical protein VKU77_16050 [Streptosporangiaceae bacterium]|nr:hypothetical protein [Streptosporangiaceae bacterium]
MCTTTAVSVRCGGMARPISASAAPETSPTGAPASARPLRRAGRGPGVTSVSRYRRRGSRPGTRSAAGWSLRGSSSCT